MKRIRHALAVSVVLAFAGAGAVTAQISPSGEPLMLGSDEFELIQAEGLQVWRGRAEAMQGDARLRAGELRVYHAREGGNAFGAVSRIEAVGEVFFVTPEQTARGDRAVYTASNQTLVVSGDVVLRQGENVLTGSSLSINTTTGHARMDGAPSGSAGRRVQGVFYPDRN